MGVVASIHVCPVAAGPMRSLGEVRAVPGRGLEGDRYYARDGTYSDRPGPDREVTMIESEAVDALAKDFGVTIRPGDARRNLVTRGVSLNDLVGREFRVGDVVLLGLRLCEPCTHLSGLVGQDVVPGLVHRGGLRARIVRGGIIRVGDPVNAILQALFVQTMDVGVVGDDAAGH